MNIDWYEQTGHIPGTIQVFRELGYSFGLDWDGEVMIHAPEFLDVDTTTKLLKRFGVGLSAQLEYEGREAKSVCVGGPKSGESYGTYCTGPILFHISRARWAVYKLKPYRDKDPRAWFVGYATSKKKARQRWLNANPSEIWR